MNEFWLNIGCVTAGCLLLTGCNTGETLESSFRDAPANTREQVQEAVRLDKANSYMRAAEHYDVVLRQGLTSQQTRTIHAAIDSLFSRMCKNAAGGEIEAKQTLQTIEANRKSGR
jgi:PBP1b-binding outer membrane lipoprotein LpoB